MGHCQEPVYQHHNLMYQVITALSFQMFSIITKTIQIERGFCNPETTVTRYGTYNWPETRVGTVVQMECEFGSSTGGQTLSRECVVSNRWMDGVNPGMCFSQVTLDIQSIGVSADTLCIII